MFASSPDQNQEMKRCVCKGKLLGWRFGGGERGISWSFFMASKCSTWVSHWRKTKGDLHLVEITTGQILSSVTSDSDAAWMAGWVWEAAGLARLGVRVFSFFASIFSAYTVWHRSLRKRVQTRKTKLGIKMSIYNEKRNTKNNKT